MGDFEAVLDGDIEIENRLSLKEELFDWAESVVLSVFVVVLIFTFVLRPVSVDGGSMNPTLTNGDRLFVTHLFYTPKHHDIVVVNSIVLGKPIIKRVIGLPGDTIDIDFENSVVYVNGEEQDEPYIAEPVMEKGMGIMEFPATVPENSMFVMGDNRNNSTDSRKQYVGFISNNDIIGKAVFRFYPFSSAGFIG